MVCILKFFTMTFSWIFPTSNFSKLQYIQSVHNNFLAEIHYHPSILIMEFLYYILVSLHDKYCLVQIFDNGNMTKLIKFFGNSSKTFLLNISTSYIANVVLATVLSKFC